MKTTTVLIAALSLTAAGCSSGNWHRVPASPDTRLSNATEYDAYVTRRTRELQAGGQSADRASIIAQNEANSRFGSRIEAGSTNSASWSWTTANPSREVTLSDLDKAVDGMKAK